MVKPEMITTRANQKVAVAIIVAYTIYVVYDFTALKFPSQCSFGNSYVLEASAMPWNISILQSCSESTIRALALT